MNFSKPKKIAIVVPEIFNDNYLKAVVKTTKKALLPCEICKVGKLHFSYGTLPSDDPFLVCDNCKVVQAL